MWKLHNYFFLSGDYLSKSLSLEKQLRVKGIIGPCREGTFRHTLQKNTLHAIIKQLKQEHFWGYTERGREMLAFLCVVLFLWLGFKILGLLLRLSWSIWKVLAGLVLALCVPFLIVCLVVLGGIFLLLPLIAVGLLYAILKACT